MFSFNYLNSRYDQYKTFETAQPFRIRDKSKINIDRFKFQLDKLKIPE